MILNFFVCYIRRATPPQFVRRRFRHERWIDHAEHRLRMAARLMQAVSTRPLMPIFQ
jgi:hypothetical protein